MIGLQLRVNRLLAYLGAPVVTDEALGGTPVTDGGFF